MVIFPLQSGVIAAIDSMPGKLHVSVSGLPPHGPLYSFSRFLWSVFPVNLKTIASLTAPSIVRFALIISRSGPCAIFTILSSAVFSVNFPTLGIGNAS